MKRDECSLCGESKTNGYWQKKGGIHKKVTPEKLAAAVLAELGKALPVDGVIMGNAVGEGGNIARHSLLEAGFHPSVPGLTVDSQCGAGLEAIVTAARFIQAGAGNCYLAGGVESTSFEPARFRVGEKKRQFPGPRLPLPTSVILIWQHPLKEWPRDFVFPELSKMRMH